MTAKEICALAFDEAGFSFAQDAAGGKKSFYKNQIKNGGMDGSQKSDSGINDKPFNLDAHDKQHHHGHYDGGKCKYREDAVKKGLITEEQARQKTGNAESASDNGKASGREGVGGHNGEEPPQITAEQLLDQFKRQPESINGAKEGLKTEPKSTESPVGPITTESPVQEAVVKGLSEEAESGNPEAVKALNNLKKFNDLKEEIGAFERMENEATSAFVDRFNQLLARINPDDFDERQQEALRRLAGFITKRIEGEIGERIPPPNQAQQQQRSTNNDIDPETGLPQYQGADGKTYVDVTGLGMFRAMVAAAKALRSGKEVLDNWDKHTGRWQKVISEHNSNSVVDQNRRTTVNSVAQVTAEMMMSDYFDSFINSDGISEADKLDAIGRKAAFEAASGNAERQARIFSAFNKWSAGKRVNSEQSSEEANGDAGLDEEGKRLYQSLSELPTTEELGIRAGEVQMDPKAESYQKELETLDQQRNEGNLDAKGYDSALRQLKAKYVAQGYNPDPPKGGKNGWSHNVPANSIFHEISNDEARATLTQDVGEDLDSTLSSLGLDAKVEGVPQVDSNETTYFVKLGGSTQPANVKKVLEAIKNEMGESGIRLDTVVNGKPGYVAMHIPNRMQDVIGFNKFFEDPETKMALETGLVPIPIGKGPNGKMMLVDIASSPTPHALIGGATKSGKSVQGHNIIAALLMKDNKMCSPVIIDPKGNEFTSYQGIKGVGYSSNPQSAVKALLAQQAERRKLLTATGCRNIQEYNAKYPEHPMPYMPVVFDEMTQALQNAGGPESELAKDVGTLARLARDTGISLIGLTQNADAKSIPTELKNQLGFRMAFRTQTDAASRDLLGLTASQNGNAAKGLKGAGDGYIKNPDDSLSRFQAAFIPQSDIEALVKWRKARDDGKLESTKRTPQDIANEAREARWQEVQRQQQQGGIVGGEVTTESATPEQWRGALANVPRVRLSSDPSNHMTRLNVPSFTDMMRNGSLKEGDRFVGEDGNVLTYAGKYKMSNGLDGIKMIDSGGQEKTGLPMEFGMMYDADSVSQYLQRPGEVKNYTVDVASVGGDPSTALQYTASRILADAQNMTKAEALGRLNQAYQHYIGSVGDDAKRQKLAQDYNRMKGEMNENKAGHQYKPETPQQQSGNQQSENRMSGGTNTSLPPQVTPEDIVSPEEAQQIAHKQEQKQRFNETHKRFHPETQEGEEQLENQLYEEEAQQLYDSHESGKLTGERFSKRLSELDRNHKERIERIKDKYQEKSSASSGGSNLEDRASLNQKSISSEATIQSRQDSQEEQDPLEMFINPTGEQMKRFAEQEYKDESDKIMEDFRNHKITREEATERAKKARDKRDKAAGIKKSDVNSGNDTSKQPDESKLRESVRTESHGKPIAHATPGTNRSHKGNLTPLTHKDFTAITKSLPEGFVLEGGEDAVRDGNGNVWAHHKGGNGNGSRGWFDRNNQWHWAVNTTHPKYKGENSPEAKAAKAKWLGSNLNEDKNGREYRNIAFGTDEAVPGYETDFVQRAVLDYFRKN